LSQNGYGIQVALLCRGCTLNDAPKIKKRDREILKKKNPKHFEKKKKNPKHFETQNILKKKTGKKV